MLKITSREKGSGPLLVCLHGYGGSVLHWEKISEELAKMFTLVTPNLTHLFMGRDLLTFSTQIDLIADFIRQKSNGQPVFLSGISYGGALAWGIASRYPELISKLVLINPMPPRASKYFSIPSLKYFYLFPIPVSAIFLFLNSPMGSYLLKQANRVFRNLQGDAEEHFIENLHGKKLKFMSHILWKFGWILRNENWKSWSQKLKSWDQECLLIYDRKDPLFAPDFYDTFSKILASTNVVTTQDAGHISIVQQPKLIAGSMREYLLRDFYKEAEGWS